MTANEGSLGIIVWPAYVGVTDQWGAEPEGEYVRGQIGWGMDEHGTITGHARILVPKGNYTHLVYFYHPTARMMIGHQQLSHPFNFTVEGVIDVDRITKNDFTQLPALNGYRLPV